MVSNLDEGPVPPEHLTFKSPDGSLAWAGSTMLALGIFLLIISACEVAGAIFWARRSRNYRPVQIIVGVWGILGLIVGVVFVSWPYLASPGVNY